MLILLQLNKLNCYYSDSKTILLRTVFPTSTCLECYSKKKKKKRGSEETSIDLVLWLEFASHLVAASPSFLPLEGTFADSDSARFLRDELANDRETERGKKKLADRGDEGNNEKRGKQRRDKSGNRVQARESPACRRRDAFFSSGPTVAATRNNDQSRGTSVCYTCQFSCHGRHGVGWGGGIEQEIDLGRRRGAKTGGILCTVTGRLWIFPETRMRSD